MNQYTYPPRVTRDPDGVYRWRGQFNRGQRILVVQIVMGVCGGLCLAFAAAALVMSPDMLGVVLLSSLGVMAIAGLVSWLYYRGSGNMTQPYEMTEEHLRFVGVGRSNAYYRFKNIRRVKIDSAQNLIEVKTLLSAAPFFVPHEDFGFVQDFVLRRLSDTAEIVYES